MATLLSQWRSPSPAEGTLRLAKKQHPTLEPPLPRRTLRVGSHRNGESGHQSLFGGRGVGGGATPGPVQPLAVRGAAARDGAVGDPRATSGGGRGCDRVRPVAGWRPGGEDCPHCRANFPFPKKTSQSLFEMQSPTSCPRGANWPKKEVSLAQNSNKKNFPAPSALGGHFWPVLASPHPRHLSQKPVSHPWGSDTPKARYAWSGSQFCKCKEATKQPKDGPAKKKRTHHNEKNGPFCKLNLKH